MQRAMGSTLRTDPLVTVSGCQGPPYAGVTVSPTGRQLWRSGATPSILWKQQCGKGHLRTPLLTSARLLTSAPVPSWQGQLHASPGMDRRMVMEVASGAARLLTSAGMMTSPQETGCEGLVQRGRGSARSSVRTGAASGARGVPDAGSSGGGGGGEGDGERGGGFEGSEEEGEEDEEEDLSRLTILASAPYLVSRSVRRYFNRNPWRRALFGGLALFLGFYVAQTISLTLGALSLNDVVAAALCVIFTESVTRYYHTLEKPVLAQALLNVFKMGFMYGLFIDAFKLAS